jgi:hypothetical protein
MTSKVKPDQLTQELNLNQHSPVYLVDAEGNTTHVVLPVSEAARNAYHDYVHRQLHVAHEQVNRGESEPLDIDDIKSELAEELNEDGTPK